MRRLHAVGLMFHSDILSYSLTDPDRDIGLAACCIPGHLFFGIL
jgi:hypothetical protein